MELGIKIKQLRQRNGLTQEELADRCELTKGYISQLENDLTSPSISTLNDILTMLGTTLGDFFAKENEDKIVFTKEEQFEREYDDSRTVWLVPTSQKNEMEPILLELDPGAGTDIDMPHEGEEFGLVLEGRVSVIVGTNESIADKGDSFYYTSDKNHYLKNTGKTKAKVLWVSCPPNF